MKHPENARLDVGAARALVELGWAPEAETILRKTTLHAPDIREARVALAELYERLGRTDPAMGEYQKAVALLRQPLPAPALQTP